MAEFNPLAAAIDGQTTAVQEATDALDTATVLSDRVARMQEVDVGETPSEVVYTENKLELLHYEPVTDEQSEVPILVVYALINKPYILDLQPDRSVVRRLLEAGHDVYLIDWNEPSHLDRHLTLADYIDRYIDNCVDVVCERADTPAINLLGYCMGGTMSAVYAALYPERVNALGLMAAGLCFDDTAGTLELWGDGEYYDPRTVTEALGNMPGGMLDVGFALMDPVDNYVSKYVRLFDNIENEDFVENFGRMEQWLSEGIDVAGEAYVEFLEDFYQGNKLVKNEYHLNGRHVDVSAIDMPVLQILGEYDHLVPSEASKPFNDVIGSDDVTTIEYPTGHIGLSVSSSSHEDVWPAVAEWYHDHSPDEASAATDRAVTETALEAIGGIGPARADQLWEAGIADVDDLAVADLDTVATATAAGDDRARSWVEAARGLAGDLTVLDGIGPTFADRLREAGFETPADLAEAEPADLAEAAETTEARARSWVEQVE